MKKISIFALFLYLILSPNAVFAIGVNGDAQISGMFDGSLIVIKTTDRLAGAIDSLVWKGVEFVNTHDHGRQIQYAWQQNGRGECDNPTEAGSRFDGVGARSSSVLRSISAHGNTLTTESNPAFWLSPGECYPRPGNTSVVSTDILKKTVTIGWNGMPNIIEFVASITVREPKTYMQLEGPTEYLPAGFFNTFYTYDPKTKTLTSITPPKSRGIPGIISTEDNTHAVGIYVPDLTANGENIGKSRGYWLWEEPRDVSKWSIVIRRDDTPVGVYRYRTFMAIGSLNQVKSALDKLYAAFNSSTPPPASPTPPPIRGDIDGNGHVDMADYNILKANFGRTGPGIPGDIDGNNRVGIIDYNILVGNFGK